MDDLFFHLYGWRKLDLSGDALGRTVADTDPPPFMAHLKSARPYSRMHLTFGRQHILAGVTDDNVDGLKVSAGMGDWLSATAFGGLPSSLAVSNGNAGGLIYGARVATHPMSLYEIGVSYQKLKDNSEDIEENTGADFTLKVGSWLTLKGISNFDVAGRGWREHNYSAQMKIKNFLINPSYRYFQLDDHFEKNSVENMLFGFLRNDEEIVNIAGTDILWQGLGALKLGIRGRQYDYALRGEKALYFAALLNLTADGGSRIDVEAGRMQGETPQNLYSLFRLNLYWRNPFGKRNSYLSTDALFLDYDQPISGQNFAMHASLNGGMLLMNEKLEVKMSGIYSQDPYFKGDAGVLISFLFHF